MTMRRFIVVIFLYFLVGVIAKTGTESEADKNRTDNQDEVITTEQIQPQPLPNSTVQPTTPIPPTHPTTLPTPASPNTTTLSPNTTTLSPNTTTLPPSTTTLSPNTTTQSPNSTTTSSSTVSPPNSTTSTSTTLAPTTPTSTTPTPVTTSTPIVTTTLSPTTEPSKDRRFDGPSFIGGIVLSLGIMAIAFVAWKFYIARRSSENYHTL